MEPAESVFPSLIAAVKQHWYCWVSRCLVVHVTRCGSSALDLHACCRMGESLLNDMAAVSLEDPAEAKEAEMKKAPPLPFGSVVKKQHKWQVPHTPNQALQLT